MLRPALRPVLLSVSLAVLAAAIFAGLVGPAASPAETHAAGEEPLRPDAHAHHVSSLDAATPPVLSHSHAFAPGTGKVPSRSEALDFPTRYASFTVKGDAGLMRAAANGHFSGSGTLADPYVLERFYVDGNLVIQNTTRALILREGFVTGQLRLNYIGSDLLVHHVHAKDLRVNENVERRAPDTAGLFHDNEFGFIGQLRHFSGEFRDNTIGPRPSGVVGTYLGDAGLTQLAPHVVFNFDGFHGASVHHNVIYGAVDIKIHGHYHGDCLTCIPHDHADEGHFPPKAGQAHEHHAHDPVLHAKGMRSHHSIRYHSLHFFANEIENDGGYALRYYDRAHRADDETAASEPNPYLEDPHVHYQYVILKDNKIRGGPLFLDVFNAADKRHALANEGVLRLEGNSLEVHYARALATPPPAVGFDLKNAEGIALLVIGNRVRFAATVDDGPVGLVPEALKRAPELIGFHLSGMDRGNVTIAGNTVETADVGIHADTLGARLWWDLVKNRIEAAKELRTSDVANPPGETPGEGASDAHEHGAGGA